MDFKPQSTPESGEAQIDALLGQDLGSGGKGTAHGAEDTSVAVMEPEPEVDEGARAITDEEGADESASDDGVDEGTEAEQTGDDNFNVDDVETDFAESAYAKAAAHWAARGKTFDVNDAGDRAVLKDWMEKGQAINRFKSTQSIEDAKKQAAEPKEEKAAEQQAEAPKPLTIEQVRERVKSTREYAKTQIVPEVAMEFASGFVGALWPGKDIKISQEQANNLAETFSTFAILQIADAIPSILNAAPKAVAGAYPMLDRVHDMATREAAVDELLESKDAGGALQFPDLERFVNSGAIKQAMNGAELKDAVFSKDPYKNLVAKMKIAYKMAQGQRTDPQMIQKAVERGRQDANDRARKVAAGKLPPGSSTAGFTKTSPNQDFVSNLLGNSTGGRFARAVAQSKKA